LVEFTSKNRAPTNTGFLCKAPTECE
jgi:hypothetical protein